MSKKPKKRIFVDYGILIPYLVLCVIGVVMVYSATSYKLWMAGANDMSGGIKQALYFTLSLIIMYIIYHMKTSFLQKKGLMQAGVGIVAALLILTFFMGFEAGGAQGWLSVGGIQIQPVEFLKIMVIWYLSYILSRRQTTIVDNFLKTVLMPVGLVGVLTFLVLIQPDTGGAAIIVLMVLVMLLASGISYWYGIVTALGGITLSALVIEGVVLFGKHVLPSYIVDRFTVFKDPFISEYDAGQQLIQSYYAMFNGGWFGRGLGQSIQKKGFLPVAESDFIFSIVIEELGLVAGTLILLLLLFLIVRIFMVGIKATSSFNSLMCIGIGSMLLIQTFVNIGGITGMIPMTGVTFPFISQGGSSLLVLSIAIGLVLNIRADELRKKYQRNLEVIVPFEMIK